MTARRDDKFCMSQCLISSVFWLLVVHIGDIDAGFEHQCVNSDYSDVTGICGTDLRDIINLICGGKTYHETPKGLIKRGHAEETRFPGKTIIEENTISRAQQSSDKARQDLVIKHNIGRLYTSPYFTRRPYSRYLIQHTDVKTTNQPLGQTGDQNGDLDDIFLSREMANAFLSSRRPRRKKRFYHPHNIVPSSSIGIVCECCVNNCDTFELQQYCADSTTPTPDTKVGGI